jgi:hypothetical protein
MSLLTYDEARPWAKAIRDQVVARTMPPWGAVKGVGSFRNDPSLTEVEIQMLVAWVEGGSPNGDDDSLAPRPPAAPKVEAKALSYKEQAVEHDFQLSHPMAVLAIRPDSLNDGASMFVDAWLPDGRVEHLIWLRNYRKDWTRDYLFRSPLKLPAGATVHVAGPTGAKAVLLF